MSDIPDMPRKTSPHNPPKSTGVGKAVRYFRTLTKLSQENFAIACGVGKNTLQEIERGKRQEPHPSTIKKIIDGCRKEGLDIDLDSFNARVAEYEQATQPKADLNYTDPHYDPGTTKGKEDLTNLIIHIPVAHKIIGEIQRETKTNELRFFRGMTNTLNRIEKMADQDQPFDLKKFCALMKQFDSFVQEIERKNLKNDDDIFSMKSLREKLDGFKKELGKFYPEYKDGLIPNDWPSEDIKHQNLIDDLFVEIQQRKFKIEDIEDIDFLNKALDTLEELEIELDRNPLHLKNINVIRARLEELDRDIFKELLISSQLLLGTYADQLAPGSVFRDAREAPEMVVVPAGTFLMGSADGTGHDDERPQHKVTIAEPFAVGRYPVTFEEWDNYRQRHPEAHNPDDEGWGRGRRPVMKVSWDDTRGFLGWLEEFTDKSYRLLSEAEWEYACRAGSDTEYHFGDDRDLLKDYAWYGDNSESKTQPVGMKKPNQFGLYDMHGNVWEWCEDHWYDSYKGAPVDGSACVGGRDEEENSCVLRGGSWGSDPENLRARFRDRLNRGNRSLTVGFRVARALASNQAQ